MTPKNFEEKHYDAERVTVISHFSNISRIKQKERADLLNELNRLKAEEEARKREIAEAFVPKKSYFSSKEFLGR